jgi:hypothetical protein
MDKRCFVRAEITRVRPEDPIAKAFRAELISSKRLWKVQSVSVMEMEISKLQRYYLYTFSIYYHHHHYQPENMRIHFVSVSFCHPLLVLALIFPITKLPYKNHNHMKSNHLIIHIVLYCAGKRTESDTSTTT